MHVQPNRRLICRRADINASNKDGKTPLDLANQGAARETEEDWGYLSKGSEPLPWVLLSKGIPI